MATSTRDVLTGLAQMINDSGIATYRASGIYNAGEAGITFKSSPQDIDRIVMLQCIPISDSAMIPLGRWMVQAYFRGLPNNPMDVEDLGDAVFDLWQGATNITLGSTHAIQMLRQGSVGNGQDDSKRWTRIDRYLLDLDIAPTVNRPANGWD